MLAELFNENGGKFVQILFVAQAIQRDNKNNIVSTMTRSRYF